MFTPKDIDKATVSNYMKLQEGKNKIRILSDPVNGYEYWLDAEGGIVPRGEMAGAGGKPVRVRDFDSLDNVEKRNSVKAFAAFKVWNYQLNKVQILEIKQATIMTNLDALYDNEDWGDITSYDITITKVKTGTEPRDVDYTVTPSPKKELSPEILKAYEEVQINLEALFEGQDPFSTEITDKDLDEISNAIDQNL